MNGPINEGVSSAVASVLPTIRHFENRRGEGPGDEVGGTSSLEPAFRSAVPRAKVK